MVEKGKRYGRRVCRVGATDTPRFNVLNELDEQLVDENIDTRRKSRE